MNWNTEEQSWGITRKHIILCSSSDAKIAKEMMKRKAGFSKHDVFSPADPGLCKTISNVCLTCWVENRKFDQSTVGSLFSKLSEREDTPKPGRWHQCWCSGAHGSSDRAITLKYLAGSAEVLSDLRVQCLLESCTNSRNSGGGQKLLDKAVFARTC